MCYLLILTLLVSWLVSMYNYYLNALWLIIKFQIDFGCWVLILGLLSMNNGLGLFVHVWFILMRKVILNIASHRFLAIFTRI